MLFQFTVKIILQVLYRDLDGSLTGRPGGGWVVPDSALVPSQFCELSVPAFSNRHSNSNGTVCTSQVRFLRMAWNSALPTVQFGVCVYVHTFVCGWGLKGEERVGEKEALSPF